jgi:hypothetical protein
MFGLRESLEALRDGRPRPRIPASLVVKGFMVMLLARLGSLNGLEQVRPKSWLRRWLGGDVPSADTMGRVAQSLPPEAIRRALRRQYGRRRRNKSPAALPNGLRPVIFDRSVETKCIPRGRTGQEETVRSEWVWVTTLPQRTASTGTIVRLGHGRWAIENYGFNELANQWHADQVYKHAPNALLVLWLLVCLAYNLFHTFLSRNVKPVLRARHSAIYFAQFIAANLRVFTFP